MLLRITSPHFVAGYDLDTGNIAPIIKYMYGWSMSNIEAYCQEKNWKVELLGDMMQITADVVSLDIVNKGKYQVATIAYRDDQGKIKDKKVMSFGAQEKAFKVLSSGSVKAGQKINVEIEKNAEGYWDWVSIGSGTGESNHGPVAESNVQKAPNRGNYETPEERALRQLYIVRQSSIANAIETLNHVKKSYEVNEILTLAREFEEYVFGKGVKSAPKVNFPGGIVDTLEDDVPL